LRDPLDRVGLKAGARHLHTAGTDQPPAGEPPFLRSVELEKALADAIVAWEMNGEPLPALHGVPARLVVPGWAGDHWMKWLARIAPQAGERTGYFMDEEYRFPVRPGPPGVSIDPAEMCPITELFVKATITRAPAATRIGIAGTISGFAFSGVPDVATVEISDDDGSTWMAADLDPRHDPYAWRLWSFRSGGRRGAPAGFA
jgi:sulfite oxidase